MSFQTICLSYFFRNPGYDIYFFDPLKEMPPDLPSLQYLEENHQTIFNKMLDKKQIIYLDGQFTYSKEIPVKIFLSDQSIIEITNNHSKYLYNPFIESEFLYTELGKVELFDLETLQKFINLFGLPNGNHVMNIENIDKFNSEALLFTDINLFDFYNQLEDFKEALNIYKALQVNDLASLESIKERFKPYIENILKKNANQSSNITVTGSVHEVLDNFNSTNPNYEYEVERGIRVKKNKNRSFAFLSEDENLSLLEGKPKLLYIWDNLNNTSNEIIAKYYLVELLNNNKKKESVFSIINNEIHPAFSFENLMEVAYHQLSKAVFGNKELRECKLCNNVFEVSHQRQMFCPPLPGRKVSTCQNTYNQRMKRKRKREMEGK